MRRRTKGRLKAEAEVDGQCESGLEGEGTVGGDVSPGCVEAKGQKH